MESGPVPEVVPGRELPAGRRHPGAGLGPHGHFYHFPKEHWKHLRTTNPVESPFAGLRLRTDAAKRYKKVDNATAVIWKLLLLGERVEDQVAAA